MADKKISELTALTTLGDDDLIVVVDDVAGETKKMLGSVLKSEIGGSTLWQADGETKIKPLDDKLVDATHLTGEISGGLFHP
jgi:hypothetical protein